MKVCILAKLSHVLLSLIVRCRSYNAQCSCQPFISKLLLMQVVAGKLYNAFAATPVKNGQRLHHSLSIRLSAFGFRPFGLA